jgi:CHASE2 domain-containing sensor protein/serine phosphatase RsbU (regulator of sigma subunit)
LKRLIVWLSQIWRAGKGRPVSIFLLASFALLLSFPDLQPFKSVRLALFDQYQSLSPRHPKSQPVVIVEIDEATLGALGQWPWPRNYFAALIDAIAALKPAAVGLDIIMPEPDHASPQAVAESRPDLPENVHNALVGAASNDRLLAASLADAPVVLGAAGFPFHMSSTLDTLQHTGTIEVRGDNPVQWLHSYPYVLASLPEFQDAAHGQALLSSNPEDGIVRRAEALSAINGTITPGLPLEMMRVAHAVPAIVVDAGEHGVEAASIGRQRIPLQGNGEAWIHFDEPSRERYISALSLLKNEVPPERINGKMVLVGLTGLGLQDVITTPLGDRRPGVEVHAQLIEGFEDGDFVTRPWWMRWVELAVLASGGLLLIWAIPDTISRSETRRARRSAAEIKTEQRSASLRERRSRARASGIKPIFAAMLSILLFASLIGAGIALFRWAGLLFDASSLFMALGTVFGSLLTSVFIETNHQRKETEHALQNQRLKAAKLAGELDAARRIQLGTLPNAATAFPGETRFEVAAMLEPARHVGGDLYDFFMIDARRLFFFVGDVSGKGLPASLFMVVTKALAKSEALRENDGIGTIISVANMEMSRENPEMLFVTAVAGILDVESGALELVNAGHDAPWLIGADGRIESIEGVGGPALCVMEDFTFPAERLQLAEGDTLLLVTDGITEAMNISDELYGMERVSAVLDRVAANQHPSVLATALREDVRVFVGAAEPSDDLTLLVLRWVGADSGAQ